MHVPLVSCLICFLTMVIKMLFLEVLDHISYLMDKRLTEAVVEEEEAPVLVRAVP